MSVTPDAATVARDVQPANAFAPIAVHAVGSVTDFSAVQPANADSGISVMDVDERLMLVSVVQPASAPSAMFDTVDSTVTDVKTLFDSDVRRPHAVALSISVVNAVSSSISRIVLEAPPLQVTSKNPPEMSNFPPSASAQSPREAMPVAETRTVPPEIAMLPHFTA